MYLKVIKLKGKVHPRTGHEDLEGSSYALSLTSALDGVGGQRHAPAALHPGKTRYPLYRRLGGPQSQSGQARKISPPPGFDPRTVQPRNESESNMKINLKEVGCEDVSGIELAKNGT